jgi:hypothetical protein
MATTTVIGSGTLALIIDHPLPFLSVPFLFERSEVANEEQQPLASV